MGCMDTFFGTPGMTSMTILMIAIIALSLLLFAINIAAYWTQRRKYAEFFSMLDAKDAWGRPGRFIVPIYAIITVVSALIIGYLFMLQPHVL